MNSYNYIHQLASNTKLVKSVEHGYIGKELIIEYYVCLLYTSPSPRDLSTSRMPSSA